MSAETPQLDRAQRAIVARLVAVLGGLPEVVAVVLGGSRARGRAEPGSDVDLGLLYREARPIDAAALRAALAGAPGVEIHELTEPWVWGPWVNGGAWLTVDGQRVDLLYRCIEHVERVIDAAERGEFELHFGQQPPFGFFGPTYLGEISVAWPLADEAGVVAALEARVDRYPDALRAAVVRELLWSAEFALEAFAPKTAARGDVLLTVSILARSVHAMALALFALNRRHWLNDKTAMAEIAELEVRPPDFRRRVERVLADPGDSADRLARSLRAIRDVFDEVAELAGDLYQPKFDLGG